MKTHTATTRMFDELDVVIRRHRLHDGDPLLPVNVDCLLEAAVLNRWYLPEGLRAISVQFRGDASITANLDLYEPESSDELRHMKAHEFGHVFRRHEGWYIQWRTDALKEDRWARYNESKQEREARLISAYLLISRAALDALLGQDEGYVAALLDVPLLLVRVRREIRKGYER